MQTTDLAIERIKNPAPEYFKKYIHSARKPVIITGVVNNWQAYSLWRVDYLNELVGDKTVDVAFSYNSIFIGDPEYDGYKHRTPMKFRESIKLMQQNRSSTDKHYYLQQLSLPEVFPELMPDIECPPYIENSLTDTYSPINLWLGASGNTASLHYDNSDNILAQVKGQKRIVFFPPEQTALLYPFPANAKAPQFSNVDIDKPDLDKFPKYQKARSFECILEQGEMLFIPAFWWHQVYTLETPEFPTISVNFWQKPPLMPWFTTPTGRRHAVQVPGMLRGKARRWRRKITRKIKTKLKLNK